MDGDGGTNVVDTDVNANNPGGNGSAARNGKGNKTGVAAESGGKSRVHKKQKAKKGKTKGNGKD